MKFLLPLLFLPLTVLAFQHQNTKQVPKDPMHGGTGTVTLLVRLYNPTSTMDSLTLYESYGLGFKPLAKTGKRASDSLFVFTVPVSKPKFYVLGPNETDVARVILGEEKEVMLFANAQFFHKARTMGSPANKALEVLQKRFDQLKSASDQARMQYNTAAARNASHDAQKALTKQKIALLDSLKGVNQPLWRVATLNIFPDFVHQSGYTNEIEFYGKEYFSFANIAGDRAYDDVPDVTQGFENYLNTLMQVGASQDQIKAFAEQQLGKIPAGSKSYRMALAGLINGAKVVNSYLYPNWVKQYLETYRNNGYGEISRLDYEMKKAGTFTAGFDAPDLVGMTPDSSQYALTKMRGKVVLVDFWASWCGPCRREMPNVKANYTKYKDKGFDILGVSLDRDMTAWKGAIQQDGLEWHHISDLKGWQSAHAALYSITSIPQTILVDKEGRIIARNIRGEQLGDKLKEIFGN